MYIYVLVYYKLVHTRLLYGWRAPRAPSGKARCGEAFDTSDISFADFKRRALSRAKVH